MSGKQEKVARVSHAQCSLARVPA